MSQATFYDNKIDQWESRIKWAGGPRVWDHIGIYPPYAKALSSIRNSWTQNWVTKDPLLSGTRGYGKENEFLKGGDFFTGISPYWNGFGNQSLKRKTVTLRHALHCTVVASIRFPAVISQ